jgi:hypothetical protein
MWPERETLSPLPPKSSEAGTTVHFTLSRNMRVIIDGVSIGDWIY